MNASTLVSVAVLCALSSASAHAAYSGGSSMAGGESTHLLSVGAGISSPSVTSAIGENPAGIVNNQRLKLLAYGFSDNTNLDPLGFGGTVYTGNGSVGIGLGYQHLTGAGNGGSLVFGLGAEIQALKLAFGAAGSYSLVNNGATRLGIDVGMLFNTKGDFTVGASAFGLENGPDSYGLGVSYAASPQAQIVVDSSVNDSFKGLRIKPALGVSVEKLQMTFGYGIEIDKKAASYIRDGAALGVGFEIAQNFHLQAYYNQIAKYFLGLTIRF